MEKKILLDSIATIGLNLYDAAIIDDNGMYTRKYQPCNNCNNSYSVAKAFTVTAIGLLQDDGLLRVDDPISKFLRLPDRYDKSWENVTIEHALTHKIGFTTGFLDIDTEDVLAYPDEDYLNIVLSHPLGYPPGSRFVYSDAAFYLLSRIVLKASGRELDEVLRERLITPLGFRQIAWSRCPGGHTIGATGLYISSEDMVKLGWLYVNNGNWNGKQIISQAWVKQVLANGYEFKQVKKTGLYGKGGLFGQMLMFDPEKRVAYAWHGFEKTSNDKCFLDIFLAKLGKK